MTQNLPEPWLRGPIDGVDARLAPVLFSFEHAREDLAQWTEGFTTQQIWTSPNGLAPLGLQLRHIAGSTDRLTTYLRGPALNEAQICELRAEQQLDTETGRDELLARIDEVFRKSEQTIRAIDPASLAELRTVGRKALPTSVIGLLTHIAEHLMRHVGEVIITVKIVRSAAQ